MDSPGIVVHSCRLRCGITEVNKAKKNHLVHGIFFIPRQAPVALLAAYENHSCK